MFQYWLIFDVYKHCIGELCEGMNKVKFMIQSGKMKYIQRLNSGKRFSWNPLSDYENTQNGPYTDVIYYNQKLALECNGKEIEESVKRILKVEFPDWIEESEIYNLLVYVLTNRLCTMQSIKNVLSYKKQKKIRQIKDVNFNKGEVQLTCLT